MFWNIENKERLKNYLETAKTYKMQNYHFIETGKSVPVTASLELSLLLLEQFHQFSFQLLYKLLHLDVVHYQSETLWLIKFLLHKNLHGIFTNFIKIMFELGFKRLTISDGG